MDLVSTPYEDKVAVKDPIKISGTPEVRIGLKILDSVITHRVVLRWKDCFKDTLLDLGHYELAYDVPCLYIIFIGGAIGVDWCIDGKSACRQA